MASVLVIDDDPILRHYLRQILESDGHVVSEAADLLTGLWRLRGQPADLVFCNPFKPDTDVLELLRSLRRESPATKIVAMSGGNPHGGPDSLRDAPWSGTIVTLSKPFGPLEALAAADLALGLQAPSPSVCSVVAGAGADFGRPAMPHYLLPAIMSHAVRTHRAFA